MRRGSDAGGLGKVWDLRRPERALLLGTLVCIAIGFLLVLGSAQAAGRPPGLPDLLPLVSYVLGLIVLHLTLVMVRFRGDQVLPALVSFLSGLGLIAQYRMGVFDGADLSAPARYLFPAGLAVMLSAAIAGMRGRYRKLASRPWLWAGLSAALVALVLVTGQRFRGGVYGVGFVTPTEALKVTVIVFLAALIDRESRALGSWGKPFPLPPFRELIPLTAFWALLVALLLVQRDLGMVVILSIALLVMLAVGTGRIGYLVYGLVAAAGLGFLALELFAHGQRRVATWLDPFQDPTGDGWQVLQGLSGMYSGGLWGEGFGRGNPEYTPIAKSDFIYSVIGEELGFVGCAVVVVFFLIIFERGLRIAERNRSSYGTLLTLGLITVMVTQTFLNIGGVTKLIPLTGITLPFISQGGSSLLSAFAALGLILAVSDGETSQSRRKTTKKKVVEGPQRRRSARATSQ